MLSARVRVASWALFAATLFAALAFWTYEVIESPGNQIFGKTLVSGPSDQRVVALTFDDGPNPPYTQRILDVLDREHVHATFFVVGRAVAAYPTVVAREARSGDAIGNHTWDHAHLIVMNSAQVRESLRRTDAAIYAASGVHTHLMRPPFGMRDWIVLDQARKMGYTPVMWSVPLARDWEYPSASVIASRVLPYVHDGSIIVLHDGNRGQLCAAVRTSARLCDRKSDIEATALIVRALKKQGYRFVTIPQLLAIKGTMHTPSPGSE